MSLARKLSLPALAAALVAAASPATALDCNAVAQEASDLFVARASKDMGTYSSIRDTMLGQPDHRKMFRMLVRAVDEGLYATPESMQKAATKYCTRTLASN